MIEKLFSRLTESVGLSMLSVDPTGVGGWIEYRNPDDGFLDS